MTVQELHGIVNEFKEDFKQFKKNDFHHLKCKVDWIFYSIITLLLGTIGSLVLLIIKK